MTPVKYIGKRVEHIEGAYGTRVVFKPGESILMPDDVAQKLLKHPDVYAPGNVLEANAVDIKPVVSSDDDTQDLRDSVLNLDSYEALNNIAANDYGQKLDKRKSIATLRTEVISMIDRFGAV